MITLHTLINNIIHNSYINDINNSVYSNNSLTLVNFDLGQLYNSNKHIDVGDTYLVLPITMVAAYTAGNTLVAPTAHSSALCSIKSNFLHLIHQCDLTLNGKTIESTSSFINVRFPPFFSHARIKNMSSNP